jgi:EmrB/QacA subfamily drug resistance transporter
MSEAVSAEGSRKFRHDRFMVTAAMLLAMVVTALEQTVVSTAMPSIIAQLHGLEIYPWVFSAYLLASTVTTPLYGKLADLLGRKRVLLFGLGLFALGSMLSGLAQSMPQLIAMRVVQGLGAGAVGPIVLTMIADLFTLEERAKVQGLFSVVWGGSSVIGPFLGGVLTDQLSWRWVFFVTTPFAIISAWILVRYVHESLEHREVAPIDWTGAGLLALGTTTLLLAVLNGADHSLSMAGTLLAVSVVLLTIFVACERRAADPILPIDLMVSPHFAAAIAGSFLLGALLFGIDTYLPLFIQGVRGGTATEAGRVITPLFLSWSISVAIAARVVVRLGFRVTSVVGALLISLGMVGLVLGTLWPELSGVFFLAGMIITGLGMGPTSLTYVLGVQNVVAWNRRGAATGAVIFFRIIGGALGVGLLGATLGWEFSHRMSAADALGIDVAAALRPQTHELLTPAQLQTVQAALGLTLRHVFLQMLVMALLTIACSLGLRGGKAPSHGDAAATNEKEPEPENLEFAFGAEL